MKCAVHRDGRERWIFAGTDVGVFAESLRPVDLTVVMPTARVASAWSEGDSN